MIIVQLSGGMGNQLFQYAAAKALSIKHSVSLKVDISSFATDSNRNFELQNLIPGLQVATAAEINSLLPTNKISKLMQYFLRKSKRTYYREPHFHFDPAFQHCGPNVYLKGLFQSERYFNSIESLLKDSIQPAAALITNIQDLSRNMRKEQSVSIHIRRGDYLNPATLAYHGVLGIEYYKNAIRTIKQHVPDAVFYIFTDDASWTKDNLQVENAVFVSQNYSKTHYEDFFLMSCCKHQIIANSSFSWWGAYLNKHAEKIVAAPKKWFNEAPVNSKDLIPANWKLV